MTEEQHEIEHEEPSLDEQVSGLMSNVNRLVGNCVVLIIVCVLGMTEHQWSSLFYTPAPVPVATQESRTIIDGVDSATGLVVGEHYELIEANCSGCHSLKLVTQNRNTREGWKELIVWMQETQKLWDLGNNEPPILDYLAANYGPEDKGRRPNLPEPDWYELK